MATVGGKRPKPARPVALRSSAALAGCCDGAEGRSPERARSSVVPACHRADRRRLVCLALRKFVKQAAQRPEDNFRLMVADDLEVRATAQRLNPDIS